MPKKSITTNPSAERNAPRDIIFDMEDDIGDLRRLGATIMLISTTDGLEDVVQDALHQVANGLSDCHRELKAKFNGLFDQIVREKGDTAEAIKPAVPAALTVEQLDGHKQWSAIYARWLSLQVAWAEREAAEDVSDKDGGELLDKESDLVLELALTSPALPWQVAQKVGVLEKYMERSNWSDRRDEVLLASIKSDLEALS